METKAEEKHPAEMTSTEIGRINREIAKSVSDIFDGVPGATGRTISLARSREKLLLSRGSRKKTSA